MTYSQNLKNEKPKFIQAVCVAGVTPEIDLEGGTLCGVLNETELTSTFFTVSLSRLPTAESGVYCTLVDPDAAGADRKFNIGATSDNQYVPISPLLTAGFRYCKINFDQSETPTVYIARRSME